MTRVPINPRQGRDQMQSVKSPRQLWDNYAFGRVRARVLRDVLMHRKCIEWPESACRRQRAEAFAMESDSGQQLCATNASNPGQSYSHCGPADQLWSSQADTSFTFTTILTLVVRILLPSRATDLLIEPSSRFFHLHLEYCCVPSC